jgi:ElaB/YqjD/DUF883 family membrane-anchored ribosome-binding protein
VGNGTGMTDQQEDLRMSTTNVPDLGSHTVAWFRSAAQLRAAESALERQGIDSRYIQVARPSVTRNRRAIDRRTWSAIGKRAAVGIVVGALIGLLVGLALGNGGTDLFAFAFALAIAGAPLGGIYVVATKLPTQEQSFDTFGGTEAATSQEEEWIAVSGPTDLQNEAVQILQEQHPVRIDGVAA